MNDGLADMTGWQDDRNTKNNPLWVNMQIVYVNVLKYGMYSMYECESAHEHQWREQISEPDSDGHLQYKYVFIRIC